MTIVAIAGPIAAGKSELAKALAARGVGIRASFGDYVRQVAHGRDLDDDRNTLQRLGEELIAELGAVEFADRALPEGNSADLVVDGVRHLAVSDALAARTSRYLLVFVDLDDVARRARLEARGGDPVDLAALDAHSTEREVPLLRERAQLVVGGDDSEAWRCVVKRLESGGAGIEQT